jgi:hypothetical protein
MAIYAFLHGELPARHLPDVDEDTLVEKAKDAAREAFSLNSGGELVLSYNGVDLTDEKASLRSYGVPSESLIKARRAS